MLPLCWWRRFAGYITESEGSKKDRRKGRSEGRSLDHHGKMRATQVEDGKGPGKWGKEKGLFWQEAVKLQILGMVFCPQNCVLRGVCLGVRIVRTPAACDKPWFLLS